MATYIKGNITYTPVVEQINRKFTVRKNVCVEDKKIGPVTMETANYMGGATRVSARNGLGVVRKNYFFYRENAAPSETTEKQMETRAHFTAARQWADAAVKDLGALAWNQKVFNYLGSHPNIAYLANDKSGAGYTFYGLHFAWACSEMNSGEGNLPTNHKLPAPTGMPEE